MSELRKAVVVFMVEEETGNFAMLERSDEVSIMPGKWCLPGGKVDEGESYESAAARETIEETGIVPSLMHDTGIFMCDGNFIIKVFTASAGPRRAEIEFPNREHKQFSWVSVKDVPKNTTTGTKKLIQMLKKICN